MTRTAPLKRLASLRVSNVDKKSVEEQLAVRLCNYTDVYYRDQIHPDQEFMAATATPEQVQQFRLRKGDVVITKDSETADDIAVPSYVGGAAPDLICGYHLAVLRPRPEVLHPKYLYWSIVGDQARDQFTVLATGVTRYGLRQDEMGRVEINLHPLPVQRAIADYLDAETARIDALIERRQRMATLVQERLRSKISALTSGEPTVRVRHVTSLRTSGPRGWSERVGSSGQPFVRSGNLRRTSIDLDLSDLAFVEAPTTAEAQRSMIRRGDVLVGITGANTGWVGLPSEVEGGFVSQHVAVLRPSGLEPAWLAYSLFAHQAQDQLLGGQYGGTKQQLGLTDLAELSIFVPPLELQRKAVHQIATEAARAAALLSAITAQVGLLAERRQAMITAAVAGELEVSGMAA